jgi:GNAT superfamily N-acetyltransferase
MKSFNYFYGYLAALLLATSGLTVGAQESPEERKSRLAKLGFTCEFDVRRARKQKLGKYEKALLYFRDASKNVVARAFLLRAEGNREALKTARVKFLVTLPHMRNLGLGSSLLFDHAPQLLAGAGFEKMHWVAHPYEVDSALMNLPLPVLYDEFLMGRERLLGRLEERCCRELSQEEYELELPRLCSFYERHGAKARKHEDGSYVFLKDEETGRNEVEFILDLKSHIQLLDQQPNQEEKH